MKPLIITLDGPAGAGKSTVAKALARRGIELEAVVAAHAAVGQRGGRDHRRTVLHVEGLGGGVRRATRRRRATVVRQEGE